MLNALVLLGCRILPEGVPGSAAARRAMRAAHAYREHQPRWLVVSGGRRWHGVAESEALAELLRGEGVPASVIVNEWCSLSTLENAFYSARLLRERAVSRAGIVTCDYHLPRALAAFRSQGVEAVGIAARAPRGRLWKRVERAARERVSGYLDRRLIEASYFP